MALVLDATPGSPTANSYATVIEADAYHEGFLYPSAWEDADDKEKALVTATRLLDENVSWVGYQKTGAQALAWPRSGALTRAGYLIDSGTIPQAVKNATAELARILSAAGAMPNSGGDTPAGLKLLKAGSVELQYDPAMTGGVEDAIPVSVWSMINFLVESRQGPNTTSVPLVRT